MVFTAASFFSGIGGIDLAFSWSGFDIRFQCEIDSYCQQVLKKHAPEYWPNAKLRGDIRNVTKAEVGHVDVVFGGFPCQDISIAGKRAGITTDTRSGLWFELLRLISDIRPRVVLLENVAAIHVPTVDEHGNQQPAPGLVVTASLSEIGYDAIWLSLRASDIGAPHQRERWFCVAYSPSKQQKRRISKRGKNGQPQATIRDRGRHKMGNAKRKRLEGTALIRATKKPSKRCKRQRRDKAASLKSRLGRVAHGLSRGLDRHSGQWPARRNETQYNYEPPRVTGNRENRVSRIKSLGNAVVPQQVLPIVQAIKLFLETA